MQMYVMFNCNDFKYCSSTPTLEAYGNPLMINNRKKLIQRYEQEIQKNMSLTKMTTDVSNINKAFDISILIEDDSEYLGYLRDTTTLSI